MKRHCLYVFLRSARGPLLAGMLVLAWLRPSYAQDITMTAEASPQQAAVGQNIRLTVTVEGKVNVQGSPALPALPDFQVYGGGRSSNFSFINGQVSSSLVFTYILVPKHPGQFTIGPVTILHAGKTYSTPPLTVVVASAGSATSAPPAPRPSTPPPAISGEEAGHSQDPVFITTQVDRKSVYVNERLTLTFRFFTRVPTLSQPQYQPPETNGFWSEDLPPQREYITRLSDQEYRVIEIQTALFPTSSGEATISPARLMVDIQNFQRQFQDPFADDFFNNFFSRGRRVTLSSQPITVNVKPLPSSGRPANFTGTVGQWSLSAKLDRRQAKVGEAVTLEVRIFGEGNVKSVTKPELPALTGFKVYETISSSDVQKDNGRVKGVKIYRTLLRPEVTGTLTVPSMSYNYFDPKTDAFEEMSVPALTLEVLPGAVSEPMAGLVNAAPEATGPGVKVVAQDIRYLKTRVPLQPSAPPLPAWFWMLGFGVPPLVLLGLGGWRQRQNRLAADPRYARRLTADSSARKTLRQAQAARVRRDEKSFYAALHRALTGYWADHMGASRAGITQREIMQHLRHAGVDDETVSAFSDLLDECDFARFASGVRGEEAMAQHQRQAEQVLEKLAQFISRGKKR